MFAERYFPLFADRIDNAVCPNSDIPQRPSHLHPTNSQNGRLSPKTYSEDVNCRAFCPFGDMDDIRACVTDP